MGSFMELLEAFLEQRPKQNAVLSCRNYPGKNNNKQVDKSDASDQQGDERIFKSLYSICLERAQANPSALWVPRKIPNHFTEKRVYFHFWAFHFWHYKLAGKHIFLIFFQLHNCLRANSQLLCWLIFLRSPGVIKELQTIHVSTGVWLWTPQKC